jgi:hypothetical protein
MQAAKFYASPKNEKSLAEVYDTPKSRFINWIKDSRPKTLNSNGKKASHDRVAFKQFLDCTTVHITPNTSPEGILTPEPKSLSIVPQLTQQILQGQSMRSCTNIHLGMFTRSRFFLGDQILF